MIKWWESGTSVLAGLFWLSFMAMLFLGNLGLHKVQITWGFSLIFLLTFAVILSSLAMSEAKQRELKRGQIHRRDMQ